MLQNTLSALLQSVASRYAELSPSDVGIGLRGGRLVVDDVQLRADTFNGPHIPFHVLEGRAGRLRVNVPWSALTHAPVQVYLENVHLIAGPKHTYPARRPSPPTSSASSAHWHQTNVGRLLFNVSVEMHGLKVEYRDAHCVGIVSVASMHAFSAGPDWQRRFVSLNSVLDPHSPHATAVTMRKLVRLGGVHWVMIPRTNDAAPQSDHSDQPHAPPPSPRHENRRMDLQSYETHAPILDGIPISVKVLLHSGTAHVDDRFTPGLHAEIHIDIEDPTINLTARQIKWIDNIIKAGFGLGAASNPSHSNSHPPQSTASPPKRRRPQSPNVVNGPSASSRDALSERDAQSSDEERSVNAGDDLLISSRLEKELAHQLQNSPSDSARSSSNKRNAQYADQSDLEDDEDGYSEHEEDDLIVVQDQGASDDDEEPPRRGGLRSFWQAIVSENADDTVDDAAIALGLANGHTPEDDDLDATPDLDDVDQAEHQHAREAVNAAAKAGGLTLQLFFRTPDLKAWEKVDLLQRELDEEKQLRIRLEDAERILSESEQRIQQFATLAQKLRDRNEALVKELADLENMTSRAGKNKDAVIRQMEAALAKAEKNLQAMLQAKFQKDANSAITKSIQVNTYEEDDEVKAVPQSSERDSASQDVANSDAGEPRSGNDETQRESASQLPEKLEEKEETPNEKASDAVDDADENKEGIPQAVSGAKEKELSSEPESVAKAASKEERSDGSDGTGQNMSVRAPDGSQERGLTEIRLHDDRYSLLAVDSPSVSIKKLIADMSTTVDVAGSSRNKHVEAAMSSEGLTLI